MDGAAPANSGHNGRLIWHISNIESLVRVGTTTATWFTPYLTSKGGVASEIART